VVTLTRLRDGARGVTAWRNENSVQAPTSLDTTLSDPLLFVTTFSLSFFSHPCSSHFPINKTQSLDHASSTNDDGSAGRS
jgi:hypothetical protein